MGRVPNEPCGTVLLQEPDFARRDAVSPHQDGKVNFDNLALGREGHSELEPLEAALIELDAQLPDLFQRERAGRHISDQQFFEHVDGDVGRARRQAQRNIHVQPDVLQEMSPRLR